MNPDGVVVFSTDQTEIGEDKSASPSFNRAKQGQIKSNHAFRDRIYAREELIFNRRLISSYMPIRQEKTGSIIAVAEVYTDVTDLEKLFVQSEKKIIAAVTLIMLTVFIVILVFTRRSNKIIFAQQEKILHLSTQDKLTGLPDREVFYRHINEVIRKADREHDRVALLLVDLDHFREINDKFGHSYGNELLKIVTHRLKECLASTMMLARLGDDEFAIVFERANDKNDVINLAHEIMNRVQQPVTVDAEYLTPAICTGISIYNDDSHNSAELLQHADAALFHAKSLGGSKFQFFASSYGMRNLEIYELEYELTRALEEQEFVLYYQPKIDVSTGQVVGAEALMRWNSYLRGFVSPNEFIPVMEASGLIHPAGEWAIRQVCETIVSWQTRELPVVPVSVNVSAVQFRNPEFVNIVKTIMDEYHLAPGLLELELTESCLMEDASETLRLLTLLKDYGVSISIDDFGTGYSSLSYLKRFPIDTLKIDRSFIHEVHNRTRNDNAAIVTAIMSLSHSLRLDVIAEGVETARELAYLNALGCRIIQGFLFSEPLPQTAFEDMLVDNVQVKNTLDDIRQQLA